MANEEVQAQTQAPESTQEQPKQGDGWQPDWRQGLPNELQAEPFVATATDLSNFVKQAVDAHKSFGSRVPLPKGEVSEETFAEWQKKVAPEKPEGYALQFSDDVDWLDDGKAKWMEAFHKAGIPNFSAQRLLNEFESHVRNEQKVWDEQESSGQISQRAALEQAFGQDVEEVQSKAKRALKHLGANHGNLGEKVAGALQAKGLNEDPDVLRFLNIVHDHITEDSWAEGATRQMMSPQQAHQKMQEMMNYPKTHPFKDRSHRDHRAACKEYERLQMIELGHSSSL